MINKPKKEINIRQTNKYGNFMTKPILFVSHCSKFILKRQQNISGLGDPFSRPSIITNLQRDNSNLATLKKTNQSKRILRTMDR